MDRCAACGADDEMLFACRHCERPFCRAHLLDHGCDDSPDEGTERGGAQAAVAGAEGAGGTGAPSVTGTALGTAVVEPERRNEETSATARANSPMRPMDARRPPGELPRHDPETVAEWVRQQTYLTFLLKVGSLALLLTFVVFGGLAVVRYGLLGVL